MPLYEYQCANCAHRFEMLRPMSQADSPAACPRCAEVGARRMISVFAAVGKDGGSSRMVAGGGGGCGSCSSKNCASCGH